jgi:hypothetical protein
MAGKRTRRPRAVEPVAVPVTGEKVISRFRVKAASISSGPMVEAGGGTSQQIPYELLQRMSHEIIVPPLGERSFEDFAALLIESTEFSRSVFQIATDVAGLGWHLKPVDDENEMDASEVEIATKFLEAVNPNSTLAEIIKCTMIDFGTLGNGWVEVLRENNDPAGLPSGLVHAPGLAMRLRQNLKGHVMLGRNTRDHAFFRTLFSDPTEESSIDPTTGSVLNEMIYFRTYHPASPYYGVPTIVPAIQAIKGNTLSTARNLRFFTNRSFPEYLVEIRSTTDNVPTDELAELEQNIDEHFKNILRGEDYKTLRVTLPAGVSIHLEALGIKFDDVTLRQYRIDNRDEVVRSQGMMPNRIGIIESGNLGGGTGASQIEIYKTSTIKPPQEMFERVINMILHQEQPKGFGLKTVRWKIDEIDTIDEAREASIASQLSATGWLTVNEGRAYASQFLKIQLEEIEEPWADLPLQLVVPQLAQWFEPLDSELQQEPGMTPGLTSFGTPELTPPQTRSLVHATVAVDKAYRRFHERRELASKVVAEVSANGD